TAAMGIALGPNDWAIRCNLVTVENEHMRDFTAGHISSEEGRALIQAIQGQLGGPVSTLSSALIGLLEFHPGVSYRNILVYRAEGKAPFDSSTKTQPPHDIPDHPITGHLPSGSGREILQTLMMRSREVLAHHPVNVARRQAGKRQATQI